MMGTGFNLPVTLNPYSLMIGCEENLCMLMIGC